MLYLLDLLKDSLVDHDVLALGDINDLSELSSVMSDSGSSRDELY